MKATYTVYHRASVAERYRRISVWHRVTLDECTDQLMATIHRLADSQVAGSYAIAAGSPPFDVVSPLDGVHFVWERLVKSARREWRCELRHGRRHWVKIDPRQEKLF